MKRLLKKISIPLLALSFLIASPIQNLFAENIELWKQVFKCPTCNGAATLVNTYDEWKVKFVSPCCHGFINNNDYTLENSSSKLYM